VQQDLSQSMISVAVSSLSPEAATSVRIRRAKSTDSAVDDVSYCACELSPITLIFYLDLARVKKNQQAEYRNRLFKF